MSLPIRLSQRPPALVQRIVQHTSRLGACAVTVLAAALPAWAADLPTIAREQLDGVVWMQQAVEYRGNALQTYRLATSKLATAKTLKQTASAEQARSGGYKSKKPAVVLDIDETVLDNMPFNALLVRDGRNFDAAAAADWEKWVQAAQANAVPGAREFLAQARAKGFKVIFITNRQCNKAAGYDAQGHALDCPQKAATIANLDKALGFRPAPAEVLLRDEISGRDDHDKQARREEVAKSYRIAMLLGDDLNDFIRRADYSPDSHAAKWGEQWFALSNPVYGSWQGGFPEVAQKYAALNVWTPPAPPPPAGGSLQLTSWNLAWFSELATLEAVNYFNQCLGAQAPDRIRDDVPFCNVYIKKDKQGHVLADKSITSSADYTKKKIEPIRTRLAELAAQGLDVLAVEETQNREALQAVLPPGFRVACFTTRLDAQNVGFAVREAANLQPSCREINALSLEDNSAASRPVRRGLELTVNLQGKTVTLLNVHLKCCCPTQAMDQPNSSNCAMLQLQAQPLEAWVEEQAQAGRDFLIIGDWNRDLDGDATLANRTPARSDGSDPAGPITDPKLLRNFWLEINDLKPAASAMQIAAVDRSEAKNGKTCEFVLDQLALSATLVSKLDPASLSAGRQPAALLARPEQASDHCPLRTSLQFR